MLTIENLQSDLFGPISLNVAAGDCLAVMGPSGAGKSLFLRAIADLDPNQGNIALGGAARSDMPAPDWRRKVALVPAESGWWADRVGDHFTPDETGQARITELVAAMGLDDRAMQWSVDRLSSGERHRLAIARALALQPSAILLDEPTASLDAASAEHLEALLRRQLANEIPIILVTHDEAQAARLASRTLRLADGRVAQMAEAGQ